MTYDYTSIIDISSSDRSSPIGGGTSFAADPVLAVDGRFGLAGDRSGHLGAWPDQRHSGCVSSGQALGGDWYAISEMSGVTLVRRFRRDRR
jgi:hypothetical protein